MCLRDRDLLWGFIAMSWSPIINIPFPTYMHTQVLTHTHPSIWTPRVRSISIEHFIFQVLLFLFISFFHHHCHLPFPKWWVPHWRQSLYLSDANLVITRYVSGLGHFLSLLVWNVCMNKRGWVFSTYLGCRGTESSGWFDVSPENSAWDVVHGQASRGVLWWWSCQSPVWPSESSG